MGRNVQVVIVDEGGEERAVHRVPYGARLFVDEGDAVKRGQRIAEWDPYMRPVLTEASGTVDFEDLVEGSSVTETADESTGITKRVVIDWRANPRGADLKPAVVIKDEQGQDRQGRARPRRPLHALRRRDPVGRAGGAGEGGRRAGAHSARKRQDARHHRRSAAGGGAVRGAAAEGPRDHRRELSGTVRFGRDYKNKRRIIIEPTEEGAEPVEYLIPKGRPFHLQEGDTIEKGDFILDGLPAPHDILAIKGVEELAAYLVNEIQEVYRLQGVLINDKHIEVIVRQMLQKVEITETGDSDLLAGEQLDRLEFDEINEAPARQTARSRRRPSRCCSASPRRACRPAPSSRRRRSRRPRAC